MATTVISIRLYESTNPATLVSGFLRAAVSSVINGELKVAPHNPAPQMPAKPHLFAKMGSEATSKTTVSVRVPADTATKLKTFDGWQETLRKFFAKLMVPAVKVFTMAASDKLKAKMIVLVTKNLESTKKFAVNAKQQNDLRLSRAAEMFDEVIGDFIGMDKAQAKTHIKAASAKFGVLFKMPKYKIVPDAAFRIITLTIPHVTNTL